MYKNDVCFRVYIYIYIYICIYILNIGEILLNLLTNYTSNLIGLCLSE